MSVAEPSAFRYRAFLSYSHRDTSWGKWLHAALEGYRIDKDVVGRQTPVGVVPKTLRPIFRDREDFSAGHSLNDQTLAALEGSQFVVVICSPNAARSQYVNEEIRRFKAFGRGDYVIPIIVDGEPGDPERECFPPALRFKIGPDGALTDEHEEPIAADARPQGDGKDGAKLKLVAGLLGVGLDEIVRREERARRQRLRNWVGALALLTLTFAGLAVYAEVERRHAVEALNAATQTSNSLIYDLAARFRTQMGVPAALVKDILGRAQKLQQQLTASGQTSPDLQHSEASALSEAALTLLDIGDSSGAFDAVDRSRQILEGLLAKDPRDSGLQLDLSVVYQRIGDTYGRSGKRDDALAAYEKARTMDEALVKADQTNEKGQDNLAVSDIKIGDLLGSEGKLDDALAAYQKAVAIREALVQRSNLNADWWRNLGASYERVGMVLGSQNKLDDALAAFQKRVEIAQKLSDQIPGNTDYLRDISVGENRIGDVYLAQSKFDDALAAIRKSLAIRQQLAASDKDNAQWSLDVAVGENEIGRVLLVQEKFDEALAAYRQGLAIEQALVARDNNNTVWQNGLCNTELMIGLVQARQDKLDDAGKSFLAGIAIAQVQSKAHPQIQQWQGDLQHGIRLFGILSNSYALDKKFDQALAIADQSIGLAPNLIWFYLNRANALMLLGRTDEARAIYLQYHGKENVKDQTSWGKLVLADFTEFRKEGITNPLMDEIEKQFAGG
jgi:tetratricopeptide (TPR) repeat protein